MTRQGAYDVAIETSARMSTATDLIMNKFCSEWTRRTHYSRLNGKEKESEIR